MNAANSFEEFKKWCNFLDVCYVCVHVYVCVCVRACVSVDHSDKFPPFTAIIYPWKLLLIVFKVIKPVFHKA